MMKYFLLLFALLFLDANCVAAEIALVHAPIDVNDMASIKRGAKFFATTCMACHTLIYLRYDPVAQAAGITYEKMPINVKSWPLNIRPPDLSLETDVRGVDWIYTYLHSFYADPARPTGVNNLVLPNTAMAGIVTSLQGRQILATDIQASEPIFGHQLQWYDLLVQQSPGSMTPEQFDATMADVVNFLNYAAAPYRQEQNRIGYWVIGFLIIFGTLLYLLKKNYWKDIHK